jgi:hypothetical protein
MLDLSQSDVLLFVGIAVLIAVDFKGDPARCPQNKDVDSLGALRFL